MRSRLHWIFDHHVKNAASIVRSPFGLSSTNQTWICFVIALSFGLYGLLEISCNFNTERLSPTINPSFDSMIYFLSEMRVSIFQSCVQPGRISEKRKKERNNNNDKKTKNRCVLLHKRAFLNLGRIDDRRSETKRKSTPLPYHKQRSILFMYACVYNKFKQSLIPLLNYGFIHELTQ